MATTDYSFLGIEGLTGDRMVRLENYGRSNVSYTVTLSNGASATRNFRPMISDRPAHSIQVSFDELYQLSQMPGGMQLIFDNLYTSDMEVRKAIGLPYDEEEVPEIKYSRSDVTKLVQNGSEDELMDLVEFGVGAGLHYIAEWMKEDLLTVDSNSRRSLIGKMLNIDSEALIDITNWMAEDDRAGSLGFGEIKGLKVDKTANAKSTRRVASGKKDPTSENTTTKSTRRVKK